MVGCGVCPILDLENVLIGVRMYLHDRCYPRFFIGGINVIVWVCLLVNFILSPCGPWESWSFARVGDWCGGLAVELGVALCFVGLFYVFGIGCAFPPFVLTSL